MVVTCVKWMFNLQVTNLWLEAAVLYKRVKEEQAQECLSLLV